MTTRRPKQPVPGDRRGFAAPRIPMPPYRYVPGSNPHPLRHPEGHLRTRRAADAPRDDDEAFRHGIDLFDHAYYWEAHEVWEALWHAATGAERLVLQSLIQLAAGHLKRTTGRPDLGAALYARARRRLEGLDPREVVLGIPIARLRRVLVAAEQQAGDERPPSRRTRLVPRPRSHGRR